MKLSQLNREVKNWRREYSGWAFSSECSECIAAAAWQRLLSFLPQLNIADNLEAAVLQYTAVSAVSAVQPVDFKSQKQSILSINYEDE